MKKFIFTCIGLWLVFQLQSQTYYFSNLYSFTTQNRLDRAVTIIKDGNFYISCGSSALSESKSRLGIIKTDISGNLVLRKTFADNIGSFNPTAPRSFLKLQDGGYLSIGEYEKQYRTFGYVMKFNADLDSLWTRIYGEDLLYTIRTGIKTNDGGLMLLGDRREEGHKAIVLLKTDMMGNQQWYKEISLPSYESSYSSSIDISPDGGYYIGGHHTYPAPPVFSTVTKADEFGNQVWNKSFYFNEYVGTHTAVKTLPDSGVMMATATTKFFICRISKNGSVIWQKEFGSFQNYRSVSDLILLEDGNFVASGQGHALVNNSWKRVGCLFKFSLDGDSIWYREYYKAGYTWHELFGLAETEDNGLIGAGYAEILLPENADAWLLKVNSLGCESPSFCWVGVQEPQPEAGSETGDALIRIAPNPAKESTVLNWKGEALKLEVYSADGREVYVTNLKPSQKEIRLNVNHWPPGLYLVRVVLKSGSVIAGKFLKE
jgi:hypothetical protein